MCRLFRLRGFVALLALAVASGRLSAQPGGSRSLTAEHLAASLLRDSGDYLRADSAARHTIRALERAWGADDLRLAAALGVHADILFDLDAYPAADSAAARAAAILERRVPADDPLLGEALSRAGMMRGRLGDHEAASTLLQRALRIQEARPRAVDVGLTLHRMALLHLWRGELEPAMPLLDSALAVYRAHPGVREADMAWAMGNLAMVLRYRGETAAGMALLREAFAVRQRVLPGGHPRLAAAALILGSAYENDGDFPHADSLYGRALEIYRRRFGEGSTKVADALEKIGGLRRVQGELEAADSLLSLSVAVFEARRPENDVGLATARANLAIVRSERGQLGSAEGLLRRSLTVLEARLGPEHPNVADVLSALAHVLQERGDFPRAVALRQRALGTFERVYGPESPNVATALNNLAVLYGAMHDEAAAEPLLRRALAISERSAGASHPDVAWALMNLATRETELGRHAEADSMLRRATRILDASPGANPADRALVRASHATAMHRAGYFSRGDSLMEEAAAMYERALGADNPQLAAPLRNLALTYVGTQQPARAVPLLRRVLALQATAVGPNSPAYARALVALAMAQQALGQADSALADYTRADDLLEHHLVYVLPFGSEAQKQGLVAGTGSVASLLVSLHLGARPADPAAARAALTAVLRRKGRALDATVESLDALRARLGLGERALLDRLAGVRARWARLVTAGPVGEDPTAYRARVAALAGQAGEIEREIGGRTATLGLELTPVSLDAVQVRIPSGAALVEIATYSPSALSPDTADATVGESARYAAYVLLPSGAPQAVDLGPAAALDSAVLRLRQALADPRRADARARARELDARLMAPLRPLLAGASTLLVAPDGALNLVPFGALVDERGHYLLQDVVVAYLTSGRDLLRMGQGPPPAGGAVIVASPAYGEPSEGRAARWGPLDAAREEATLLQAVLPGARVLIGAGATEAAVKAVSGPSLLHVATHGWFVPEPGASAAYTPALLRAGLAFAGANAGGTGDGEDGVLTAMEAAGLNLRGTRLVVLSACETGLGDVRSNDGVYGLRRALLLAGAESQVMTLWRVDDRSTRDAMVAYYERLRAGEGRAEALRHVQLSMLAEQGRAHPFWWAAFVTTGDWRPLPETLR